MTPTIASRGLRSGRTAADARARCARRGGTVLIVTMWILIVLAGMVLVFARTMQIEGACSANHEAQQQATAIEDGAIQYVLACVDGLDGRTPTEADMPSQGVQVGAGAFWIVRPDYGDGREQAYGVVGEAAKINLNTATEEMLSVLPGMTLEMTAATVDWRDSDGELTPGGAESEYYLLLPEPYDCKNGPLETVEELLLVKLASTEVLFGEDTNRNGHLDDNENDADDTDPPDNRNGSLDGGIIDLVTVYSAEPNIDANGEERVNVNQGGPGSLARALREWVSEDRLGAIVGLAMLGRPFANILDFYFRTGMTMEEFTAVADRLTTTGDDTLRGLINVRTAPSQVLLCLPELTESDVSALLSARSADSAQQDTIAWVAEAVSQEKAVAIGSRITTRSYQFSADIVSVTGNGRAFKRCRIVVDARESPPKVIHRRDLTSLGWPLSPELLAELRSGTSLAEVLENTYQEAR